LKASIELLTAAMACQEFNNRPDYNGLNIALYFQCTIIYSHSELRNGIIGVFFKALTLRSKDIVLAAKKGLSLVIQQHKLPKELLQTSLRPILLNLADHRKLSVPLLQGLARLLELLTNCFNVTLGGTKFYSKQKMGANMTSQKNYWNISQNGQTQAS